MKKAMRRQSHGQINDTGKMEQKVIKFGVVQPMEWNAKQRLTRWRSVRSNIGDDTSSVEFSLDMSSNLPISDVWACAAKWIRILHDDVTNRDVLCWCTVLTVF